ncbi:MAG TPA: CDP-2,3-bis-(O-geranylgeranyl)-sn-glycerol synthase [archaeon]|nr:CDP-2,3-bis-(O-geranylgeranyl)-sn-glycerol synthase [archaeon]
MGIPESEIMKLILYLAPMYFANSSAMLFGGKTPVDFGKKFFDGKPVFGKGKTFRGSFAGIAAGTIVAAAITQFFPEQAGLLGKDYIMLGFALSLGAIIGDMAASFFKRRNNIEPGKQVLFLDQLDFVMGGMIFGSAFYVPDFYEIIFVGVLTLAVHKASNYAAFRLKLKKVPW